MKQEEILLLAEKAFGKSGLDVSCKENYLKGFIDGFLQGYKEEGLRIAMRLLDKGFSCERVASIVDIPLEEIEKLL